MENKQIDILDILLILAKHKKFIFITTLIVCIIAVIYALFATQFWVSTSTFIPRTDESNTYSLNSSLLGGLTSSIIGNTMSDAYVLVSIMESRTFSKDVIEEFDLIEYFEINEPDTLISYEAATRALYSIVSIGVNDENGIISISVETKDKYLSSKIANYYLEALDEYNQSVRMTKGRQKKDFIQQRIIEVKAMIDSLAAKLVEYKEEKKLITVNQQLEVILSMYSQLTSQKITNDIELEYSKKFLSPDNQVINNLRNKSEILTTKIKELESNSKEFGFDYIISINDIPQVTLGYQNIILNLEIQKKIYEYLYPQYEAAKIDELKDLPTLEIIDKGVPSGLRSRPKRAMLCIIAFISSLVLSSLVVLLKALLSQKNKKLIELKRVLLTK